MDIDKMVYESHSENRDEIECILDEADQAAAETDIRLTHDEVFGRLKRRLEKNTEL